MQVVDQLLKTITVLHCLRFFDRFLRFSHACVGWVVGGYVGVQGAPKSPKFASTLDPALENTFLCVKHLYLKMEKYSKAITTLCVQAY